MHGTDGDAMWRLSPLFPHCRPRGRLRGDRQDGDLFEVELAVGLVGIVTERDIVRALHERGPSILATAVRDLMSGTVTTCLPTDSVDSLAETMTEQRIRHLPVMSDGRLVGIVSIGDVVKSRIDELQAERDQLASYIHDGG